MTQPSSWPFSPFDQPRATLSADAALLSGLLGSSRECVKLFDGAGCLVFMNEAGRRLMEVSDFESLQNCSWDRFWPGEANPPARRALAEARASGFARFEATRSSFAGNWKHWDVQITALRADDGRPDRLLVVSRDISGTGEQARQRQLAEYNHRLKNQMAMVQSIVNQTLRGAYPLEAAKRMIAARLDVLARTHDLLMNSAGERAAVQAVVETGTEQLDRRRLTLSGPELFIGPKAALSLALILHELAGNALAHGAFLVPEGRIAIAWHVDELDDAPALALEFRENGGPPVKPPQTRGFGTRLLQAGLSGSASQAELAFHPDGVCFRLRANLESAQTGG